MKMLVLTHLSFITGTVVAYLFLFLNVCFSDVNKSYCSVIFGSDMVYGWTPLGKELLTRLTICFKCLLI